MEVKRIAIPEEMTKEQEKGVINAFVEALPADSYLAAIFKGMAAYCESEIDNDFGISPLDTIANNYEAIKGLEVKLETQEREISHRIADHKKRYDLAMRVQDKQDETINDLDGRYNRLKEEAGTLALRNLEIEKQLEHAEQEARFDHDLIIKLKAEIYDYMMAEREAAKQ